MAVICPGCHTQNSDNNRFCSRCGAELTRAPGSRGNGNVARPAPAPGGGGSASGFGGGIGLAAFILSITSCALCALPYASSFLSLGCGIVGLVFSIRVRKRLEAAGLRNGKILAAFIMSIVGTALSGISLTVFLFRML